MVISYIMKLLTNKIIQKFEEIGSQEHKKLEEQEIIVKFFNPSGIGTWYATEYNPETKIFFGWVSLFGDHNDECGNFSLKELEEFRGAFGLGIERDLQFGKDRTLKEIIHKK